ncbi:MAG: AbrB/MazE/SpoVT family DNA-binding domain-containing protein [Parcubacteria group bacterium CG11_big_fil_rev_8_21_14_0_20_39_22]|nr:MAG: AbrB/MazE/SpoVT family DNA-binding domain-containing protein [Parcubacteria group bacterium CG11_big_fil_rev_8_21_14_0_20_39_22]
MKTTTRIQKWGNSLAVRLPRGLADSRNLQEGSEVSLSSKGQEIVMKSLANEETLKGMVSMISKDNLHKEFRWGDHKGKELW